MAPSSKPNGTATGTDTHKNDFDRSSSSMSAEQLLEGLFNALQKLWLQGRRIINLIMTELGGNEVLDGAVTWCVQQPDIAICVLAASLVIMLPLLIIFGFGIATLVITFTGILVLEGTLLTVVVMIFLACIGSLAIAVAVFAVVAYFGFAQIYGFFGMDRHRDALVKFVQQNQSTENTQRTETVHNRT